VSFCLLPQVSKDDYMLILSKNSIKQLGVLPQIGVTQASYLQRACKIYISLKAYRVVPLYRSDRISVHGGPKQPLTYALPLII
jgi:hypothetical protein